MQLVAQLVHSTFAVLGKPIDLAVVVAFVLMPLVVEFVVDTLLVVVAADYIHSYLQLLAPAAVGLVVVVDHTDYTAFGFQQIAVAVPPLW